VVIECCVTLVYSHGSGLRVCSLVFVNRHHTNVGEMRHTIDNDNKDKAPFLGVLHQVFTRFRTNNNNTVKPVLIGTWE
jgi:hypothetical protein